MGKIATKELLDKYFKSVEGKSAAKQRAIIDKPELYAYEQKIGKELVDMDVDDLFGLVNEISGKKNGKEIPFLISHYSIDHITVLLRAIFNYYIDITDAPMRNPLYDKRMKGREATRRLAQDREVFRFDSVQKFIKKLHVDQTEDRADYVELIMLLYYSGFSNAEEIATLKGDAIDHKNKTVTMADRTIYLTDRCYELLQKFANIDVLVGWRPLYLTSYKDGYFKFIVQQNQLYDFNDRSLRDARNMINRQISVYVNEKYDTKISYSILYWLGFYDSIVKKYGEKETNRMLLSFRNSDDVAKLMDCARNYGVKVENVTHLKRFLRPFVKEEQ